MKNIKHTIFFILFLLIVQESIAQGSQKPFNVYLKIAEQYTVKDTIGAKKLYNASMRIFLPDKSKASGRAILICPGGAYIMVALSNEGYPWAEYLADQGIAAIVLKYRLPRGNFKIPVSDAEEALKMIQDSAKVWNINPNDVGIMGFSAGGHLASTIATHTQPELRPKFQILFYSVISMDKNYTHTMVHDNFLGKEASREMEDLFSNEKHVNKYTPAAFVVLSADDQLVSPSNSLNYYHALIKNNIYATLHVYPTGGHGWAFSENFKFHNAVLDELTLWLNQIK